MPFGIYPLLFATGLIAGLVDSIAGGGGLLTLPVLLAAGLPAPLALGTNKLQASFGSTTAVWHYARCGVVALRDCWVGIAATFIGAMLGAHFVQRLSPGFLEKFLPWLLAAILIYSIFRPDLGLTDRPARMRPKLFFTAAGLALGFYDGFFGPGTGSFWAMACVLALGFNFTKATGYTKVMNATSNLASLICFAAARHVVFAAGLSMAAGQILGARLGAGLVVRGGARFVRPIFLTMVALVLARVLYVAVTR
ncbi:MAG: TSUP family transporter [Verrucomicrobiota bacterium]|nr:TSUP family transporter [Verrucomicrobiota bacterium]